MADLLARMRAIDKDRARLLTYSKRIKLARIAAPQLERRVQTNIDRRFNDLTRERRQLLEIIRADPVLRKRFFDYEDSLLKAAGEKPRDKDRSR